MLRTYRVNVSVRARGQTPFDQKEIKSENFDDYEEYAEAVKQFVLDNIYDDLDQEGEDEAD